MRKMNKTKLTLLISVILSFALALSVLVAAATYDTTKDPLISLSYLTKYVSETLKPITNRLDKLEQSGGSSGDSSTGASTAFQAIFVEKGQQIQCTEATEVILRSGSAVIVSPFDNQGLSDLTNGTDLKNGVSVPKNHNLLIPRGNDGRGIKITSDAGAYVMVGGAFKIVDP